MESGETRRLYLSRTPLQAAGNTPEWRKKELPRRFTHTQERAHTHTYTHTHIRTLRLILPSCGGIDYRAFPLNNNSVECVFVRVFVRASVCVSVQ